MQLILPAAQVRFAPEATKLKGSSVMSLSANFGSRGDQLNPGRVPRTTPGLFVAAILRRKAQEP
jgi:hypothetical protein